MTPPSFRSRGRLLSIAAAAVLTVALVACSTSFRDGDDAASTAASATNTAAATPTRATPMAIVTPTPFVPGASAPAGTAEMTPTSQNPETYVVREGDSLYSIALRFDVELDELIALNGLSDPNDIQVGQELHIPPGE